MLGENTSALSASRARRGPRMEVGPRDTTSLHDFETNPPSTPATEDSLAEQPSSDSPTNTGIQSDEANTIAPEDGSKHQAAPLSFADIEDEDANQVVLGLGDWLRKSGGKMEGVQFY